MKRHQVMDLFCGNLTEEFGEWIQLDLDKIHTHPQISSKGCKVKIKSANGEEKFAYYYPDKAIGFSKYGITPSYFWDCKTKDQLFNVTHWKNLKEKQD